MILKPDALDELLAREPEALTDADVEALIAHFREQRKGFLLAELSGKTKSTKATKSADPTVQKLIEDLI